MQFHSKTGSSLGMGNKKKTFQESDESYSGELRSGIKLVKLLHTIKTGTTLSRPKQWTEKSVYQMYVAFLINIYLFTKILLLLSSKVPRVGLTWLGWNGTILLCNITFCSICICLRLLKQLQEIKWCTDCKDNNLPLASLSFTTLSIWEGHIYVSKYRPTVCVFNYKFGLHDCFCYVKKQATRVYYKKN